MKPAPVVDGLFDYALSPYKSELMDIYFSARCLFFLGSCSGAFSIASAFGVPVATANNAPLVMCLPWGKKDIGIPKLYRNAETKQLLPFKEIFFPILKLPLRQTI